MQINDALKAKNKYQSDVEQASEYIENFDILETITNVGNDEVFTPVEVCNKVLDMFPIKVWSNPDYKWLNPVDKNGVFHREIALRLDLGLAAWEPDLTKRRKHILQSMLFSVGLTKFTSEVARRTLYYCSVANRTDDGLRDKDGHSINGYAIGNGEWFNSLEGNIKNPITKHQFKKGKCVFCGIKEDSKYNDPKQIEHYAYEFIHKKQLLTHLQDRFFNGDKNMKFDIIIGNPPYQLSDGGAFASAMPIYHHFVNAAISLNPKYLSMIIPSRWYTDGKGLDTFRETMISDKRLRLINDFVNSSDVFNNVEIKGGVCYFLWDRDNPGKCRFNSMSNNVILNTSERYLSSDDKKLDIVLRDSRYQSIISKISIEKGKSFSELVSSMKPYGLRGDVFKAYEKYGLPALSFEPIKNGYEVIGLAEGLKKQSRFIAKDYPVPSRVEDIEKWKIFTPRNVGTGVNGTYNPEIIIAKPGQLCTETYLQIGPFSSYDEANNVSSYMKTKFFRFLVEIRKNTQGVHKDKFAFIPILDFQNKWIDLDLYKKFKLVSEEIDFIETTMKEMS
jgi:site-specific DNA-methyltransferase (adenine-specific)